MLQVNRQTAACRVTTARAKSEIFSLLIPRRARHTPATKVVCLCCNPENLKTQLERHGNALEAMATVSVLQLILKQRLPYTSDLT